MHKQQQQHHTVLLAGGGGVGGGTEAAGSESYSSNSSFTDSYSDSSDLANWEEYVADDGTLFYAEYMPQLRRTTATTTSASASATANGIQPEKHIEFTRRTSLRMGGSGGGGGVRGDKKNVATAATRKQQQQQAKANAKQQQQKEQQQQQQQQQQQLEKDKHKFSHIKPQKQNNCKQLELVITAADRYRFGRRSTAVESILGFRVVPFPDKPECLMVDSFVHDMPTLQQQVGVGADVGEVQSSSMTVNLTQKPIKRGDWFKSLDDIDIRASNIDELLLQFLEPTKVCLKFQGPAEEDSDGAAAGGSSAEGGASKELEKIETFKQFAELFEKLLTPTSPSGTTTKTTIIESTNTLPFALLILPPECYQSDQHKDSMYYYPEDPLNNFLYKARGSFLTLNAVLSEELQTKPVTSKLLVNQTQYYVNYRALNGFLVLFAFAAVYQTHSESNMRAEELITYLRFAFPELNLENFAHGNASTANLRQFLHNFCEIQRVRLLTAFHRQQCQFEELLKESRHMPLPKEAQLRIFDALSEMEAMDYRNWNDEPLNTHREFFIYGSVLYYDHYMLVSQLTLDMRANVECFLRCRGIFDFISKQCVKELYVWEEIALPNATGRYYLTICSRSHLILAVVLKIFDAPDISPSATVPPSLFYIEEIQETLDHLIQCGIESLAMFWSVSNKRPEVLDSLDPPENHTEKESRKLESFLKQKLGSSAVSSLHTLRSPPAADDETHLCASLAGSSIHSLTPSEEDSSRKRLTHNNTGDDSDSGSDWEHFAEQNANPLHYALDSETQAQMTESLWKEINNVVPVKISAGWKNSVFYYVYVDNATGTAFCPLKANSESFPFLKEMRKACHAIHDVLQSTKSFRRLLAQESTKPSTSKGMLAIKEHGMTIQIRDTTEQAEQQIKSSFVVVGRLFFSPTKEVYVCHHPNVPQNMVEMAFRLSFFSGG